MAELPPEQYLSQVHIWSDDKVRGLFFKSSNRTFLPFAGFPAGTLQELQKPIFGFYVGVKDGALVSLGFYTLVDFGAVRGQTAMVGGKNGTFVNWDDTSSAEAYSGACLPALASTQKCRLLAMVFEECDIKCWA